MSVQSPSPRMLRVSVAILIGVFLAILLGGPLRIEGGVNRIHSGGDFLATYSAARLYLQGRGTEIYDREALRTVQSEIYPDLKLGELQMFGYPPYVASIFSPLAHFSYERATEIYLLSSLCAWFLACLLLTSSVPSLRPWFLPISSLGLVSYPTFRAILGGQNSTHSVLLISIFLALLAGGNFRRFLAGLALGALFYKPQLGAPLLVAVIAYRLWAVVGGAAVVGAFFVIMARRVGGDNWLQWWLQEGAGDFYYSDALINAHHFINVRPFLGFIGVLAGGIGEGFVVATSLAALVIAMIWGYLQVGDRNGVSQYIAFLIPASLLFSLHSLYYDATLLVIPAVWLLARDRDRFGPFIGAAALATWVTPVLSGMIVHPIAMIVGVFAIIVARYEKGPL